LLGYLNQGFWTGGVRLGGSDKWYWRRTGEEISVNDPRWVQGQPDELTADQSVLIIKGGTIGWFDIPVELEDNLVLHYALCEF